MNKIVKTVNTVLDTLFPFDLSCCVCDDEHVVKFGLCQECFNSLPHAEGIFCERCGRVVQTEGLCRDCLAHTPAFKHVFSPFAYEGTAKSLILKFKYAGAEYLAAPLAMMLLEYCPRGELREIDKITAVPMHPSKQRDRGYNQAVALAKRFSLLTGIEFDDTILKRTVDSAPMASLDRIERMKKVKNLYSSAPLHGERILLIDDVITTGATLSECARIMLKSGASSVTALTLAQTIFKY